MSVTYLTTSCSTRRSISQGDTPNSAAASATETKAALPPFVGAWWVDMTPVDHWYGLKSNHG